ncbi:MAG: 50S ribosomal protein L15e [archaeon]
MEDKMSFYKYLKLTEDKPSLIAWRKSDAIVRVERPTRLDRARSVGYKAKQGFVIVRARVKRGGRTRPRPAGGRRPTHAGINRYSPKKSLQWIAEERVQRRYLNLEVLNSYYLAEDGKSAYFEVILIDPDHPAIKGDKNLAWIAEPQHKNRVFRGLTSAGKKSRGLRNKGKGAEKMRPSLAANKNRGK